MLFELYLYYKLKTKTMNNSDKILVGGQALRELGSDRYTHDLDYLVFDQSNNDAFITSEDIDLLNAASKSFAGRFFNEIYKVEKGNTIASPQSLLELKAFAFVQHCQNFNWAKVDACEYDIKFLVRTFGVKSLNIVKNYVSEGELSEINKVIESVKF